MTPINFTAPASKKVFFCGGKVGKIVALLQHPLQAAVGLSPQRGQNNKKAP
jgi:hypothetical protein